MDFEWVKWAGTVLFGGISFLVGMAYKKGSTDEELKAMGAKLEEASEAIHKIKNQQQVAGTSHALVKQDVDRLTETVKELVGVVNSLNSSVVKINTHLELIAKKGD